MVFGVSAKFIKRTAFLQTCIWKNSRHLQEIYCPFLKLRFLRDCGQKFPSISNPEHGALFSGYSFFPPNEGEVFFFFFFCKTVNGQKKSNEWRFPSLHDNLLLKHRARIWAFIAYLRIQTSLTITRFDCSECRKLCCWAEKNAKIM